MSTSPAAETRDEARLPEGGFRQRLQRRLAVIFVALFLIGQVLVPVLGLVAAHENERGYPFSWHMFSRVAAEERD